MSLTGSYWRRKSREAIMAAIARNPGLVDFDILKAIDKAYPFGPRKNLPYKYWLEERRKTMSRISTNPILRVCGACGAGIGRECHDMGTNEFEANKAVLYDARKSYQTAEVIRQLELMCVHRARLAHLPVVAEQAALDLPLFQHTKVGT